MLIRRKISCKNNIHISIVSHFMYEYDAKCSLLLSVCMCLCCCGFLSVFIKFPMALWCIVVHLIDSNSLGSFALLIQSTQSRKEKKKFCSHLFFTFNWTQLSIPFISISLALSVFLQTPTRVCDLHSTIRMFYLLFPSLFKSLFRAFCFSSYVYFVFPSLNVFHSRH